MDHLTRLRQDLERLVIEARKAACYSAVARAWELATRQGRSRKWNDSECQPAMHYAYRGTDMAFAVTLAAVLEEGNKKDRVSLPRIVNDLRKESLWPAIAEGRLVTLEQVEQQARKVVDGFDQMRALAAFSSLKALRGNVVAHHGRDTNSHGMTYGQLNALMDRTVTIVDDTSELLNGDKTDTRDLVEEVRHQAIAFWDKGMKGDPFGVGNKRR